MADTYMRGYTITVRAREVWKHGNPTQDQVVIDDPELERVSGELGCSQDYLAACVRKTVQTRAWPVDGQGLHLLSAQIPIRFVHPLQPVGGPSKPPKPEALNVGGCLCRWPEPATADQLARRIGHQTVYSYFEAMDAFKFAEGLLDGRYEKYLRLVEWALTRASWPGWILSREFLQRESGPNAVMLKDESDDR